MALSEVGSTEMGKYLKYICRGGVYNNLNAESAAWDMVKRSFRKDAAAGRAVEYNLLTAYGIAAAQSVGTGSVGDYPLGQDSEMSLPIAYFREHAVTIQVPQTVMNLAKKDFGAYGKPVIQEVENKSIALARVLSSYLGQDGTGIIGTVDNLAGGATADPAVESSKVRIYLDRDDTARGHIGWFFEKDLLKVGRSTGPTAATINGGTAVTAWRVDEVNRVNDSVLICPLDSSYAAITASSISGTDIQDADWIRRLDTTYVQGSGVTEGTTDISNLTEIWPGFEAYAGTTGHKIWNVAHQGTLKASVYDVGSTSTLIDPQHIRAALTNAKNRVGQNKYKYKYAWMSPECEDALAEERESDRVFQSYKDATRGAPVLSYAHRKDLVEFAVDEFFRKDRIYIMPQSDIFVYLGGDFEFVETESGQIWQLKGSSTAGKTNRKQESFMEGCGTMYCQHPAAFIVIRNFGLS